MRYYNKIFFCCVILACTFAGVYAQESTYTIIPVEDSVSRKVNIGFREIDKRDLNADISVVNPGEYIDIDYSRSITDGFAGRIGGLLWSNNIWGMENALVMIDGVPRNYSDIRLEEVAQITVLKGVNAVALYGSHASKGVILITTKRGESAERKIKVWASKGIGTPKAFPEYLSAADYMEYYNEARVNDGLEPKFSNELISLHRNGNKYRYRYPDIDYYSSEYLKKSVNYNNVNAELNAGNKDARFYSNIGWYNNSTLLNVGEGQNEGDNRFNIRGNVDLRLNRFISSTIDISAVMSNSRRGLSNYWGDAAAIQPHKYSPLIPIGSISPDSTEVLLLAENSRNIIDGKYILGGNQEYLSNPFADLYAGGYLEYVDRILQVTNTIKVDLGGLTKGLSFNTRFNADYYNSYIQAIENSYSVYQPLWDSIPESTNIVGLTKFGSDERSGEHKINATSQTRGIGLSLYFDYQRTFGQRNNISAMLIANGITRSTTDVVQPNNNTNLGLQLGYNYDHRYWVDFSGALVSSNKLPENKRTGFSPTISFAWLASSEDFLSGSSVINHLKLSTSAGILNTDIEISDYYLYENIYSSQAYYSWLDGKFYNQATTSVQGANPNLSYIQRKEVNIGMEASLFKNMVWFQAMYFTQLIDGLPTQRFSQYPNYYTTLVPYTNYNSYSRSGFDLLINLRKQIGDMVLNMGVNAIYTNTKVKKWDELNADVYQNRTGKPVDAIFGLVSDGFFNDVTEIENSPAQIFGVVKPGDIKYVNQNSDNIVDPRDAVEIGKLIAPFAYGINLSANYKGFTLFIRANGSIGGNGLKSGNYYWVQGDNKYSEVVLDRWTEETRNTARYPRLTSQQSNNNFRTSDFWIYDADYISLSKVQISYDFPLNTALKSYIRQFAVFLKGSNLLLIAKNKDIMELNVGSSPQFQVYELGLRANF